MIGRSFFDFATNIEYEETPLAQYTVRYQPDKKHFKDVPDAKRFETPYRSLVAGVGDGTTLRLEGHGIPYHTIGLATGADDYHPGRDQSPAASAGQYGTRSSRLDDGNKIGRITSVK